MTRVLVVDDEPKLGRLIAEMLALDGYEVVKAGGGREALVTLASRELDVVVTDLRMPEVDGLAVLAAARARPRPPDVVLMTAYGTAESAVAAMKAGAADYVLKPFSMEELRLRVRRLAAQREAEASSIRLLERLTPEVVAECAAMKAALASARQVAATDATVLLLGESGTGRIQLARYIHYQGKRAAAPPSRRPSSRESSSGTSAAPSPGPTTERSGTSQRRVVGRCSSTEPEQLHLGGLCDLADL